MSNGDNPEFRVSGESKEQLEATLRLALNVLGERSAGSFVDSPTHGLILRWHDASSSNGKATNFMIPRMTPDTGLVDSVWAWLVEAQKDEKRYDNADAGSLYGEVSQHKGWLVYTEDWGHVDDDFYALVAVKPYHLWFGK